MNHLYHKLYHVFKKNLISYFTYWSFTFLVFYDYLLVPLSLNLFFHLLLVLQNNKSRLFRKHVKSTYSKFDEKHFKKTFEFTRFLFKAGRNFQYSDLNFAGGAAHTNGLLRVDDVILTLNQIDLTECSYQEAVRKLRGN